MAQDIREMNRRLIEAFDAGKEEVLDELIDVDGVDHQAPPGFAPGLEGMKQIMHMLQGAITGLRTEIVDEIVDEDTVVTHSIMSGKHTGDLFGIPATGKDFSVHNIDIVRFKGGKAVEHWGLMDQPALMEQLGLAPSP